MHDRLQADHAGGRRALSDAAIALIKGQTPKTTGTADDPEGKRKVPSVLLDPISITKANVKKVIDDGYQKASDVCTGAFAAPCQQAGIS